MALKQTKILYNKLKGKKQDGNEEKPLMKNIKQTDEQTFEYMQSSDQSGQVYLDLMDPDVKASDKKALDILRKILSEQSNLEDLGKAAEVLKRWSKLNGVTIDKKEGSFPENWLCEYLQEVDQFVIKHIPTLPEEGPQGSQLELLDFLKSTKSMICHEMLRLTPVLEDTGLLDHLIDSYSRHLFHKLNLLLNRDLSVEETYCLLEWGKDVFFSPDSQHVFRLNDPLLLMRWFEKAIRKLLPILKNDISETLQKILDYDEQHGHNEETMDEESFISLHIDVTQYLNAVITKSESFSKTFMCTAQKHCLKELHRFVQKYVDAEKKHLTNWQSLNTRVQHKGSVYLFRVISTCRQLRFFAPQLNNPDINKSKDLLNIICILTELEDYVWSIVQKMMKHLAQDSLRCYFKKGCEQIHTLTEAIQKQCASLPQNDVGKEIQEIFVDVAYDCVSHVYLDCLMKSKINRLEKRWGNVGERMREDALNFHNTFTELRGSDDQRNQLLQSLSEVLIFNDVNALKVTCCDFSKRFPKDSEQYVPGLLRWKGVLSDRQVREVLDVIRDVLNPNPRCVTRHSLKSICCCL
ncbi:tumor necrosis factor alpha-induced protein 2 [Siphateles boraxobius]|uniref:tumor necrosis factor alpha-induced protein 2 n=1 Tax=Siphateles boraxobius TaxID=180520 RepID=UPI004063F2C9